MAEGQLIGWDPETSELLGSGGEADVYALSDEHVVRLYRDTSPGTMDAASLRRVHLEEIASASSHLRFAVPVVLDQGTHLGRVFQIERRLRGSSMLDVLSQSEGEAREKLLVSYLETAWEVGEIAIERSFLGEIGRTDAIQTPSWQDYLSERARRSLAVSPFEHIDPAAVSLPMGEVETVGVVHLDYFPGNVMSNGELVTAVLDWGYSTIIGDRRMNVVAAAAHLMTPRITPTVKRTDAALVMDWLNDHGLTDYFDCGIQWLAAFWTFAHNDPDALAWCRSVLT